MQQRPMVLKGPDGGQYVKLVDYVERHPPDSVAALFWLKNRRPDRWRDKQDIDMSVHGQIGRLPDEDRTGRAVAALEALIRGKRPQVLEANQPRHAALELPAMPADKAGDSN